MTVVGESARAADHRVQRLGAHAHPWPRSGRAGRRGRGPGVRPLHRRRARDRHADRAPPPTRSPPAARSSRRATAGSWSRRWRRTRRSTAPSSCIPRRALRVHVLERSAPLLLEADGQRACRPARRRLARVPRRRAPGARRPAARRRLLRARARQAAARSDSLRAGAASARRGGMNRRGRERRARARAGAGRAADAVRSGRGDRRPARGPSSRTLLLDGREAGQVDLADPRAAGVRATCAGSRDLIDAFRPPGTAIDAVHVGGGAFALAALRRRHAAALAPGGARARPGRGRPGARAPRAAARRRGCGCGSETRRSCCGPAPTARADLVIGDAFDGPDVPARLAGPDFAAEMRRVLRPAGVYAST